ncbi:DNA-processing protein DprA [Porticoccus sp.]
MDKASRAVILLSLARGIGPADINALQAKCESLDTLLAQPLPPRAEGLSPKTLAALQGLQRQRDALESRTDQLLQWCRDHQVHCLTQADGDYPPLLKEVVGAPPLLFVSGDVTVLSLPQVAVVGSRHASPQGLQNAEGFGRTLAASGFAVTSGLALGIDGAAHRGALQTGKTLAVMGTGIDVIYPRQHRPLYQNVLENGGAIVSEFLPGTAPLPSHFPRRNRLISGLSLGVLVVEAALKSGSLITARYALEQGREVFAIPGSIHNPLSKGVHQLLKQGASLVESAADIVEQLGGMLAYLAEEPVAVAAAPATEEGRLLGAMGFDPVDVDTLVTRTGLPTRDVTRMLMLLELDGKVVSINGCFQRLGSG